MSEFCRTIPSEKEAGKHDLEFVLHPGQSRAWYSKKRIILTLAGAQSGKTVLGSLWLRNEMQARGPGDYLVVTPTYPLLVKKALPEFLRLFRTRLKFGDFQTQQKIFTFSSAGSKRLFGKDDGTPTQVFFGHATDPESLESATVKAAWLDEAGQKKFKLESWEAINRRVAIYSGRILITTTPYCLGWLKQLIHDPWEAAKRQHPTIDVINFDSAENPSFPKEEFERARQTLPGWKFEMFYRGRFTRPAGLIYSCFDDAKHTMPRITIPPEWPRFLGLDFGGVNTAGVFFAEERVGTKPTGRLFAYREYKAGERSAAEHCYHLMKGDRLNAPEPRMPICAGGSKSEGQWRREFAKGGTVNGQWVAGLPIHGPAKPESESAVEVGINRVYSELARNQIVIFDDLPGVLDEFHSYSRELDEMGEPTTKIDCKEQYHYLDSVRYIIGHLNRDKPTQTYNGSVASPGLQNL